MSRVLARPIAELEMYQLAHSHPRHRGSVNPYRGMDLGAIDEALDAEQLAELREELEAIP